MKQFPLFALLAFGLMLGLIACGEKKEDTTTQETPGATVDPAAGLSTAPAATAAPAGGGDATFHYICPKGCEGGGGAAQGKCPKCGGDLVHNQAFHTQQPQGATPANPIQVDPTNATPATATPPPAQNAAGVYHYTCPAGHEGGSGSQGTCAKCGAALVHNAAYHNQ